MRTETGCGGVRRRSCHPASVGGMVVVPGVEGCVPAPLSAPDGRAAVTARGPDPAIRSSWLRVCALKNDLLASRVPLHVWEDQRAQNCACQCPTPNAQSESLTHTHTHTHAHTHTHTHTHTRTHAHAHAHAHTHTLTHTHTHTLSIYGLVESHAKSVCIVFSGNLGRNLSQ